MRKLHLITLIAMSGALIATLFCWNLRQEFVSPREPSIVDVSDLPVSANDPSTQPATTRRESPKLAKNGTQAKPHMQAGIEAGSHELQSWANHYASESDPAKRLKWIEEGMRLASAHRETIRRLISEDPRRAIREAIPESLRAQLPNEILSGLERRINGPAYFGVYAESPADSLRRIVEIDGRQYAAHVFGRRLEQSTTERDFITGVAVDEIMAVDDSSAGRAIPGFTRRTASTGNSSTLSGGPMTLRSSGLTPRSLGSGAPNGTGESFGYEGGTGGPIEPYGPVPSTESTGVRSLLYLRVAFPDVRLEPQTETAAYDMMRQVNDWFVASSYGNLYLLTTVAPLVTLPRTEDWYKSSSNEISLRDDALAAAKAMGYDGDLHDHVIFAYSGGPGNFQGLASIGGKFVWLRQINAGTAAHELGHNFGLLHANSWETGGQSIIGPGTDLEYGNSYCWMGTNRAANGDFNACWKHQIGWLRDEFVHQIRQSGTYRIFPSDLSRLDPSRRYALVVKPDGDRAYWAEYRQRFDPASPSLLNGLLINWSPWTGSGGGTDLLDTTPGTPGGKNDAALTIGRTLSDLNSGIHITPIGKAGTSPESIDVVVNMGQFPSNRPPAVTVPGGQTVVATGQTAQFTVSASDPDGDPLAFAWDFGDGAFSTNNLPQVSKAWSVAGRYVVRCIVSDMKGGTASDSITVNVGTSTNFIVSGQITKSGQPLANVRVHNGLTGALYRGTYTNSDGAYTLTGLGSGNTTLNAVLYGFSFTPTFVNPVAVGPDVSGANFTAQEAVQVSLTVIDPTAREGSDTATIRLSRNGGVGGSLGIVLARLEGPIRVEYGIVPEPDFVPSIGNYGFVIPAGAQSIDIVFTPFNDGEIEGPETLILEIGTTAAYVVAGGNPAAVTFLDSSSALPVVGVEVLDSDASETGDGAVFRVNRLGSTVADLTVQLNLAGSATNGTDYAAIGSNVVIPAGQSFATIIVTPFNDSEIEGGEDVTLTVAPSAGYLVSPINSAATAFIVDDDIPSVNIVATDSSASEAGQDPATFVVTRTGDTSTPLTVNYALAGSAQHGVDYATLAGTLIIPAGLSAGSITVIPIDDNIGEPTQTVVVQLRGSTGYAVGAAASATANLVDNDLPVVTVGVSDSTFGEPGDTGQFKFTTAGSGSGNITVRYTVTGSATSGADYTPLSGSLSVGRNTTTTVTVTPLDDSIPEDMETLTVTIDPDPAYTTFLDNSATLNLIDNERNIVNVSSSNSPFDEINSGIMIFHFSRQGPTTAPLNVRYAMNGTATNGVDYVDYFSGTGFSGLVTIPAGQSSVDIYASIVNDTLVEGTEMVALTLSPDAAYGLGISSATQYLPDDEIPVREVHFSGTSGSGSENAGTVNIPVALNAASASPVTVEYGISGGSATGGIDYTIPSGTLTFDPGITLLNIPLTIADDLFDEPPQTIIIELKNAWHASLGTSTYTFTIDDNDAPPPVTIGFATTTSTTSENLSPTMVLVSLSAAKATPVTVHFAPTGGAATGGGVDYSLDPGTLTFAPGETVKALPIAIFKDGIPEANETVIITLDTPVGTTLGTSSFTLTIVDGSVVTWDANTGSAGAQDGAGVWDTANTKWVRNGANTSFVNGDTVAFGAGSGAAGTVTITGSNLLANGIVFNPTGSGAYVVAPSATETLGILNDGIVANESATMSLRPDIGASQIWTVVAGKTLSVGTVTQFMGGLDAGETLVISGMGTVQSNGSKVLVNSGTSSTIQIETGATLEMNKGTTNNALFARNATDTADATINLAGTGTLRLKAVGANTYFAGSVFHSAFTGTIECAGDGRIGAQPGTKYRLHVNSGVNADFSSNVGSTVNTDGLTGAGTLFQNNPGAGTVALAIGVNDTTSGGLIGAAQWDGAFSTTGANRLDITKAGTGTQIFNGIDDRASGGSTTLVSAGTLLVTNAAAISGEEIAGRITVQAGATLAMRGGNAGEWTTDSLGSLVTNAIFHAGARLGIDVSAGNSFAHTAAISGNQSVLKLSGGTLTLTEANTYTGDTIVEAGTVSLGASGLANTADVVITTGAVLDLSFSGTDTINELRFNGVAQVQGTWGSLASTAQQKTALITGTGILNVTGGPLPPFAAWAAANGLDNSPGKESGFDADPEKDGLANGLEWILGGNPLADSASRMPQVGGDTTNLSLTFTRADDSESSTTLVAQWGGSLGNWNDVLIGASSSGPDANGVSVSVSENATAPDTIVVTVPRTNGASGAVFIRLKATRP